MTPSFAASFDRQIFDCEIGWATDKAMYVGGLSREDVPGRGSNYDRIFEDHVALYAWILKNSSRREEYLNKRAFSLRFEPPHVGCYPSIFYPAICPRVTPS